MKQETTLKSGIVLRLQVATFKQSMRLLKVVVNEIKAVDLGIVVNGQIDLKKLQSMDLPVDAIKNVVCQMIGSDAVDKALSECMGVCLYDGEKITAETFESENARQDYLPVAWEVMQVNLLPFFSGLDLKSLGSSTPAESDPK